MKSIPIVLGVTSDLVTAEGELAFPDYPIQSLAALGLAIRRIDVTGGHIPADLADIDILVSVPHGAPIDAEAISDAAKLTAVIRVGVGYEDCNLAALTRAGIALVIPSDATQRPTAVAALTLILAAATRLLDKHRLTLEGPEGWSRRAAVRGVETKGKVLGLVGCGSIGRHLIAISRPLGFTFVIHDPALADKDALALGAQLRSLDELLAEADFVSIHCPLSSKTRHLIDARRLALMKRSAYLINTARGGIVDQRALTDALVNGRIAGAGLDVFEPEPLPADDPLLRLDNVIFSGHALNWTRELDQELGRSNHAAIVDLLRGRVPDVLVNREVLEDARFQSRLNALVQRHPAAQQDALRDTGALQ
jgi:phosphoglycerate dehydrogenase-like enzyme